MSEPVEATLGLCAAKSIRLLRLFSVFSLRRVVVLFATRYPSLVFLCCRCLASCKSSAAFFFLFFDRRRLGIMEVMMCVAVCCTVCFWCCNRDNLLIEFGGLLGCGEAIGFLFLHHGLFFCLLVKQDVCACKDIFSTEEVPDICL